MIQLKAILIEKWVNSYLIDMRAKEKVILVLYMLLVFIDGDHFNRVNLIWFRILVIVRMDGVWNSWEIESWRSYIRSQYLTLYDFWLCQEVMCKWSLL